MLSREGDVGACVLLCWPKAVFPNFEGTPCCHTDGKELKSFESKGTSNAMTTKANFMSNCKLFLKSLRYMSPTNNHKSGLT